MPAKIEHKTIGNVEHKWCSDCKRWLILDKFGKCATKWDDLNWRCRKCDCEYHRKRRIKHLELVREQDRQSYAKHKKARNESSRQRYAENPELILERNRQDYAKNREVRLQHKRDHPEVGRAANRLRRARERNNINES